jgi:predicted transposase YdaD
MILYNLLKVLQRKQNTQKTRGFSEFFYGASSEEKTRVLREAAEKANEDQEKVFNEAQFELKTR